MVQNMMDETENRVRAMRAGRTVEQEVFKILETTLPGDKVTVEYVVEL